MREIADLAISCVPADHPDAVRLIEGVQAEYVVRSVRGRGLARHMLGHLEATAAADGAGAVLPETGGAQPEAIALYESSGYESIAGFGYYSWADDNRCYGKMLV